MQGIVDNSTPHWGKMPDFMAKPLNFVAVNSKDC
jgi:hypothetical protein